MHIILNNYTILRMIIALNLMQDLTNISFKFRQFYSLTQLVVLSLIPNYFLFQDLKKNK